MAECLVDKLSVQLTTPSKPPEDASLTDINNVISGTSSAPWAVEGVANELGVVSVVADTWRSNGSTVSDYVVRRYAMATTVYIAWHQNFNAQHFSLITLEKKIKLMKCSSIKRYKLLESLDPQIFFHKNFNIANCENCVPQKVGTVMTMPCV